MAGRSGVRGRRTRVYDCNYNMGEKYYKSALDNLDRKQSGKRDIVEILTSRPKLNVDDVFEEDLFKARKRAERAITDDAFFDSRGGRIAKSSIGQSGFGAEDDIDEEVQASLNRIRASKKLTSMPKELDFEDTISTAKRRAKIDLGEKLLDAAGDDEVGTTIRRRALKMVTTASNDYIDPKNLTKWTAIDDGNSGASLRAKASKARLHDLESEMFERSEKQVAREKRSAQLKRFLVESEIDTSSVNKSEKHVNF